ncbi:hypothetical protein JWG41_18190 [Leptospira sp. 201903075]|uniref:hypothetical protein n=1 Tax=Leptospira chreensis TaxID=2810035 RepID=UPI0019663706|nr:hypothetical protein [Leptospira chreensis]MBM9592379.1 hypothetical protein [Leptospira chreensis]
MFSLKKISEKEINPTLPEETNPVKRKPYGVRQIASLTWLIKQTSRKFRRPFSLDTKTDSTIENGLYASDLSVKGRLRTWHKVTAFKVLIIFLLEITISPLSGLTDLYAQAFGRKEFKDPKGRLENYYQAGNSKTSREDWENTVNSGKNLLISEWESSTQLEIERLVKEEKAKENGKAEVDLRAELSAERTLVRGEWETELNREIDERKGSWQARISTQALNILYTKINTTAIQQAILEAEAELKSIQGTVEEKVNKWDTTIKPKLLGIRADWESELSTLKATAIQAGVSLTGDEKVSFERELAWIEKQFLSYYDWKEGSYVQNARQNTVGRLNQESDIDNQLSTETDPAEIIRLLIEKTKGKIDEETGELKEDIIKEREDIPLDFSFSDGDREKKILAALDAGQKQWEAAIEDLIVKKLQYDRNVAESRQFGEAEWSKAYADLLKERDNWLANFQKDLAEGIKAWNESESRLKTNKEQALVELDRYVNSRVDSWNSYARGLEGVALSSASSIQTIIDSIANLDELLADLPSNHSSRSIYITQRNGWTELLTKFRAVVATAEAKMHDDMRGPNGFLNPNSPERVLTTAELDLAIAKAELEAALKRRERANQVLQYAQNNVTKTAAEINSEYATAKQEFLAQQALYSNLLQSLNGNQGSAGYFSSVPGATTPTGGQSILDRLEAARNGLNSYWQTLELARTTMEEARKKYEEASKLQIYVLNRDLLGNELGVISSEVDESDPASYARGLRYDIEKANEQINNARELIRNREIEVYRQYYEKGNADRARQFYTELSKRIVSFETDKETLSKLKTLFESGQSLSQILDTLGSTFVVANIVGQEQEAAFRAEVLRLKELLNSTSLGVPEAFQGWRETLTKTENKLTNFPASDISQDKAKLDSYNTFVLNWKNSIPAALQEEYDGDTIKSLVEYSEELSADWQSEKEKVEEAKADWAAYVAANSSFFNGTLVMTDVDRNNKVLEADIKFRELMRSIASYESFIGEISWVKSELNSHMEDLLGSAPVIINSSLTGTNRTAALAAVTEFSRNFSSIKTSLNDMLKTTSSSFAEVVTFTTEYGNKFQNWQTANGKQSGALLESTNFLSGVIQSMENRVKVGKWELDFLLDPEGKVEDLAAKEKSEELALKVEGAELNDRALRLLKAKIDEANAAGEDKSVDKLRDIYLSISNELDNLRRGWNGAKEKRDDIFILSMVQTYLAEQGVMLLKEKPEFWTKVLESSDELLEFYEDGGTYSESEIARIKKEGSALERQILSDSIVYGSGMFFGGFVEGEIARKYDVVNGFRYFSEGILSGQILSVLSDSKFADQEDQQTGILSEFKTYLSDKGILGSLGTTSDYSSSGKSSEDNIAVLNALRDFLIEKSRKGEAVNPAIAQITQEIGFYTDRIADWEFVLDNFDLTQAEADAMVTDAQAHRKDLEDAGKLFGELQSLIANTPGDSLYFQRTKIEELVTKLEAVDAKINFSSEIKSKIESIKDYIWGFYKREIVQAYLTGRAVSTNNGKPDDANETLESFLTGIQAGKYFMGQDGGKNTEVSALFFGRTLTSQELDELEEYLIPYDRKINIWNTETISDLSAYLVAEDEDLKPALRLQILYDTFEAVQNATSNGYFVDQTKIPVEMREYALLFSFESYLGGTTDPTEIAALKSQFLLMLGPDNGAYNQTKINEYLSKPGKRNPSLYLPEELRELAATLDYFYRPAVELSVEVPDMASLTDWLMEQGYSSDLAVKLMGTARLSYLLDTYYGENPTEFLESASAVLGPISEEEKKMFLLTINGYNILPTTSTTFNGVSFGYGEEVSVEGVWLGIGMGDLHVSLLEALGKEQTLLEDKFRQADVDSRKAKFLSDYKKGNVSADSYISYLSIPKEGIGGVDPEDMIEDKIKELNLAVNSKLGSMLGMMETLSSNAFLTPTGNADDPSRLSLSIEKTIAEVNEYYSTDGDYTRAGDGTFTFEADLGNQVLTKINQYVNATSPGFSNDDADGILSGAYGLWESMKSAIQNAAKKIMTIFGLSADLAQDLLTFANLFKAAEDAYNSAKNAFDTAEAETNLIEEEYADKQQEVSESYLELLEKEKTLANAEALADYLALLEFSKHPTQTVDANGNIVYDTSIKSPLELAQKRFEARDKEYQDALKKKNDAQKRVDEQVKLAEIEAATLAEKAKVEEWALRSMRFSKAEQLMQAEINQLKADLKSQRDTMFAQMAGLLGLGAGSRGSTLNSFSDTTSQTFISQEQQQKEINYYANMMMEGKINHYTLIAAGLLGAEPGMGHEKWGVHPEALNPPAGIRSLVSIIQTNRPEPIISNMNLLISVMNGSIPIQKDMKTVNDRQFIMDRPTIDDAILQYADMFNMRSILQILIKCGFDGPSSALCAIPLKTGVDDFLNSFLSTRYQTQDPINGIANQTSQLKQTTSRLRRLTEITSSSQLTSVLSEAKWGLTAQDLSSIGNTTGDVDNLTWNVNGQSLKFTELVGADGSAVIQTQELTDSFGMYRRGPGNSHVLDYTISGNEFLSSLSTLAETQYTVVRDAYYAKAEGVTNDKGNKAERRDVLDDREAFLYNLLQTVKGVGVEYGMYQTILRDYMGSDQSSGGKSLSKGPSVVDEIAMLGIDQQRTLQLADWREIEKNFSNRKLDWLENLTYIRETGLARFDKIDTQFRNDWEAWRTKFDADAKAGADKYIEAIKDTLAAKDAWVSEFVAVSKQASSENQLADLYARIQGKISSMQKDLPTGVSMNLNANDILSQYAKSMPNPLDDRWLESVKNVNTDMFLTRISQQNFDLSEVMSEFEALQEELKKRLTALGKIQALTSLQMMDQNYEKIINTANKELQSRMDSEMGSSGFLRNGDLYGKISAATGIPIIVRNFIPFKFGGISVPKVKDSKGKSWDMTDLEALTSEQGPSANDLEAMAEVAIMGMENAFKTIYDPSRKVTYEQPSNFSQYKMVMAAYNQANSGDPEDPPVSLNVKDYFLVGEVVEGEFGKHHHKEFWEIMSQKETLDFLDQLLGKEQQRKAKKKADREGKIEAVVTVVAIVAASILTGGFAAAAIGPALAGSGAVVFGASVVVAGYVGYKGYQGYQAGGVAGGVLAVGSAAASMLGPAGMSIGGSYSKEQGFGFNVGAQFEGTPLNAGIGFSQKGGFGFNAGVSLGNHVSLNMNLHESGAWGVGLSLHNASGGDRRGLAANVGYRETADGQVGRSAGFGYNMGVGKIGTLYAGLTTDSLLGNGFRVNIEEEHKNASNAGALMGYEGEVGWSTGGGFQSSLEIRFNNQRFRNATKGKGFSSDQEVDLKEFDLLHKDKSDLERAKLKKEQNLPLTEAEQKAESEAKHREANTKKGADILSGSGIQVAKKDEKKPKETVKIELDGKEKTDLLTKAKQEVISKLREAIGDETTKYAKLNAALEAFEKNPGAETAANLVEVYEKTAASVGVGLIPVVGDIMDGFSVVKDLYRGNYFDATVSAVMFAVPLGSASAGKKMMKAVEESPYAKKMIAEIANSPVGKAVADTKFGKWLAAKFGTVGKKVDDKQIDRALSLYNDQDLHHLFRRGGDTPNELLKKYGSETDALRELQKSVQLIDEKAYKSGTWVSVKVGGIPVAVTGKYIDGIFRISSISKREF